MSNTAREFQNFMDLVWRDPDVNPQLSLINGAQGGRTADQWVDPGAPTYGEVDRRLGQQGLTPLQVQVVWIKQTLPGGGAFPDQAEALARDLRAIVRNLAARYPNLKIVFLSSRTRSYLYGRGLSPEPAAYESGFAVKWLIEEQIEGDPELNFDPDAGEVEAPFLAWGPYLWIDGETPRADGRVWLAGDLDRDCVHPSASGARKVAEMLRDFFLADRLAAGWFGNRPAAPTLEPSATYVPSATASQVPSPTPEVATATVSPTGTSAAPRPSGGASTQAAVLIFVGGLAVGLAGGFALGRRRRTTHPQEVP